MYRLLVSIALAGLCAVAALSGAFGAEKLTERQMEQARKWAANNALFVLYHEVAHLLVDQLQLPVLGKEEDAASGMPQVHPCVRSNKKNAPMAIPASIRPKNT